MNDDIPIPLTDDIPIPLTHDQLAAVNARLGEMVPGATVEALQDAAHGLKVNEFTKLLREKGGQMTSAQVHALVDDVASYGGRREKVLEMMKDSLLREGVEPSLNLPKRLLTALILKKANVDAPAFDAYLLKHGDAVPNVLRDAEGLRTLMPHLDEATKLLEGAGHAKVDRLGVLTMLAEVEGSGQIFSTGGHVQTFMKGLRERRGDAKSMHEFAKSFLYQPLDCSAFDVGRVKALTDAEHAAGLKKLAAGIHGQLGGELAQVEEKLGKQVENLVGFGQSRDAVLRIAEAEFAHGGFGSLGDTLVKLHAQGIAGVAEIFVGEAEGLIYPYSSFGDVRDVSHALKDSAKIKEILPHVEEVLKSIPHPAALDKAELLEIFAHMHDGGLDLKKATQKIVALAGDGAKLVAYLQKAFGEIFEGKLKGRGKAGEETRKMVKTLTSFGASEEEVLRKLREAAKEGPHEVLRLQHEMHAESIGKVLGVDAVEVRRALLSAEHEMPKILHDGAQLRGLVQQVEAAGVELGKALGSELNAAKKLGLFMAMATVHEGKGDVTAYIRDVVDVATRAKGDHEQVTKFLKETVSGERVHPSVTAAKQAAAQAVAAAAPAPVLSAAEIEAKALANAEAKKAADALLKAESDKAIAEAKGLAGEEKAAASKLRRVAAKEALESYGARPAFGGNTRGIVVVPTSKLNPQQIEAVAASLQDAHRDWGLIFKKGHIELKPPYGAVTDQMLTGIQNNVFKTVKDNASLFPGYVEPPPPAVVKEVKAVVAEVKAMGGGGAVSKAAQAAESAGGGILGKVAVGAAVAAGAYALYAMAGPKKAGVAFNADADTKVGAVNGPAQGKDKNWVAATQPTGADVKGLGA